MSEWKEKIEGGGGSTMDDAMTYFLNYPFGIIQLVRT